MALSSLKTPGEGALTAAPAKRVADDRLAVALHQAVDAASRQVGQGWSRSVLYWLQKIKSLQNSDGFTKAGEN